MKIARVRTTPVLAPLPRPVRTASGSIDRFPLVLIDVSTDDGVEGRAYAQVYLPELLPALDRTIAGLAAMISGLPLEPPDLHALLRRRCRLVGVKNLTGIALMVDCNQSLDAAEAMLRCRALDGEGLEWDADAVARHRA